METLLPQLLAFPPHPPPQTPPTDAEYDKQIKSLFSKLSQIPASRLNSGVANGGNLLDILDPSINTLPYLFALMAKINDSGGKQKEGSSTHGFSPGSQLWERMLVFMESFDPIQVRYAGHEFGRLIDLMADKARRKRQPAAAIEPFRLAILRLDPSGSTLTSQHCFFARTCLEARAYSAALPVLDKNIYFFPPTTNKSGANDMFPYLCSNHDNASTFLLPDTGLSAKITYQDHLQYFLHSAMIYMGLKEWEKAQLFLESAIVTPVTQNASKIQVEAYKKWILVNLLSKGKVSSIPHTTNTTAAKQYRSLGKSYEGLGEVFEASLKAEETNQKLIAEANEGVQIWNDDSNSGLVRQVIDAYRQFSILRLFNVYAALTIADIARRTSPDPNDYSETATYIAYHISTGKLNATISEQSGEPKTWIVRFSGPSSGPLARSEEQQHQDLIKQTGKVKVLINHIRETDRKLHLNKEFISDAKKRRKAEGADEGTSWMAHDSPFDHDEDMMGD